LRFQKKNICDSAYQLKREKKWRKKCLRVDMTFSKKPPRVAGLVWNFDLASDHHNSRSNSEKEAITKF
jgi:hypothetical protein